jgi:hypothetical protein
MCGLMNRTPQGTLQVKYITTNGNQNIHVLCISTVYYMEYRFLRHLLGGNHLRIIYEDLSPKCKEQH